jgi:hypothetical protein
VDDFHELERTADLVYNSFVFIFHRRVLQEIDIPVFGVVEVCEATGSERPYKIQRQR